MAKEFITKSPWEKLMARWYIVDGGCEICGHWSLGPVLKNQVWNRFFSLQTETRLCQSCMEKVMRRPIQDADIRPDLPWNIYRFLYYSTHHQS